MNQYYYKELWSEQKLNMYKESKGKKKMIKAAFKLTSHANEQAIICLGIQAKVLEKMTKRKIIKEELSFKQAWVDQLIDAVTMEIAESWLKLYQLQDDDKEQSKLMTKIHNYQ